MTTPNYRDENFVRALFILTLVPESADAGLRLIGTPDAATIKEFVRLAGSHHVVLRALDALRQVADTETRELIEGEMENEVERIRHALGYVSQICDLLEARNCPVVVMKSLDHWPDMGDDVDLFTTASDARVVKAFKEELDAEVQSRSWGDRLANKWNFSVPGLPELVEVHCERAGQTGEHVDLARRFVARSMRHEYEGYALPTPAAEERVIICTLQRMYRHFYFRVCDIVNTAALIESGAIDYQELQSASERGGIWPGVATLLRIVAETVGQYRGKNLELPDNVRRAARFGADKLTVRKRFLRIPIMPEGMELYRAEVTAAARRGDVPATLRLGLLPPLASAAAVAYKVTGSDKGIW